jgi:ABC-type polysaccharide/polyol phosphate export permease
MFFFISPVLFSAKSGKLFSFIFSINPVSSVMEYFRWVFLVDYAPLNNVLIFNLIITISLFFLSINIFKKTENKIADLL